MTTVQIETLANAGNIANADFDVKLVLRQMVIPEFLLTLESVLGQSEWLRGLGQLSFAAGDRIKTLPTDFHRFVDGGVRATRPDGSLSDPLVYIGDNTMDVLYSEANTTPADPAFYYVTRNVNQYSFRLSAPVSTACTIYHAYNKVIVFGDNTTNVDLDGHIPFNYQHGLVKGLRREIAKDRWGASDRRYDIESKEFDKWIDTLWRQRSSGPQSKAVFVR